MATAFRTGPELVRRPRHAGSRIAHFHLRATALTTNVANEVGHGRILASYDSSVIPAIVLAAGKSSRMGRPKANLPVGPAHPGVHDTFLSHIVKTLRDAGVNDVIIVVGHEKDAVLGSFATSGLPARIVENADYESGQFSSLLAGLRVVDRPGVVATLITLVDVPFVAAATVRAVIDRYYQTHAQVVRPTHGGRHGHPLLVDHALFGRLRGADPTEGVKPVIRAHATGDGDVEVDDEGAFGDIDTPEEYERALRAFERAVRADSKE
jgi:molybdenum cofactor cytidylyltransferase